jgi:hypothetical protein
MIQHIHQYPFVFAGITIALYWVFSAFVSGMPQPGPTASTAYVWAYTSLHALAANIDKLAAQKGIPGATVTTSSATITSVTTPATPAPVTKEADNAPKQ